MVQSVDRDTGYGNCYHQQRKTEDVTCTDGPLGSDYVSSCFDYLVFFVVTFGLLNTSLILKGVY